MNPDNNLIFLHIPKNGGSTLHTILDRNFNERNIYFGDTTENILNLRNLSEAERMQIRLLKGHMKFGVHQYLKGESEYFTFLRNPVDRIVSYYNYVSGARDNRLFKEVTESGMSLYDFVKNTTEPDVNNGQIRQISGINDREELMLEKALENIHKYFGFVGTIEDYAESVLLLSKKYSFKYPFYKVENKTNYLRSSGDDTKTLQLIEELNSGDMKLYSEVRKQLKSDIENSGIENEVKLLNTVNKVYSIYT